jgi:hypothetical protein
MWMNLLVTSYFRSFPFSVSPGLGYFELHEIVLGTTGTYFVVPQTHCQEFIGANTLLTELTETYCPDTSYVATGAMSIISELTCAEETEIMCAFRSVEAQDQTLHESTTQNSPWDSNEQTITSQINALCEKKY